MGRIRSVAAGRLVRRGFNAASWRYRPRGSADDAFGHRAKENRRWLQPLFTHLPKGARVLDLGCGCGVPTAAILSERFAVTGVDLSDTQVARARRLVPNASFVRRDMTRATFPAGTFHAVVCLYALIHVPLPKQRPLLRSVYRWLRPGGWFLVVTGHEPYEGVQENWMGSGAPMYWSHADAATYRSWLGEAGFVIERQSFVREGAGGHEFFWTRAPKRPRRPAPDRHGEPRTGRFAASGPAPRGRPTAK